MTVTDEELEIFGLFLKKYMEKISLFSGPTHTVEIE